MLTYQGQKPMSAEVHPPLAEWIRRGGVLVIIDDDKDPYNRVLEWWNADGKSDRIPRQHLFETLGVKDNDFAKAPEQRIAVGKGAVVWLKENPVRFALSTEADAQLARLIKSAASRAGLTWKETSHLALRRGPYLIGAGLDESLQGADREFKGRFVNLFDAELKVQRSITLTAGTRVFLLDLDAVKADQPRLLASACKALPKKSDVPSQKAWTVEGVGSTPAIMLIACPARPRSIQLDQQPIASYTYDASEALVRLRFPNEARPRTLTIDF
jgi:hypothetical protein